MYSCTKRTPRSTSRRAIRQRRPYESVGSAIPYIFRVACGLFVREVQRVGRGQLHARRQFVAGDAGVQFGWPAAALAMRYRAVRSRSRSASTHRRGHLRARLRFSTGEPVGAEARALINAAAGSPPASSAMPLIGRP